MAGGKLPAIKEEPYMDYKDWIDNADSYICPRCLFECNSPLRYSVTATCPRCGFTPERYQFELDKKVITQ